MKKTYVIGSQVSKSLSPTIFNYWFSKHSIDCSYGYREINVKDFDIDIKKIFLEKGLCGLNITIPFKEEMPRDCLNPYSYTKIFGEDLCQM